MVMIRLGSLAHVWVVDPSYVRECWEAALRLDEARFALPPLAGLAVCVTGFAGELRERVRELVEACGATYTGSLERGVTTHLVASEAAGPKYEAATKWQIPVVSAAWVEQAHVQGRMPPLVAAFSENSNNSNNATEATGPPPSRVIRSSRNHEAPPPPARLLAVRSPEERVADLEATAATVVPSDALVNCALRLVVAGPAGTRACHVLAAKAGAFVSPRLVASTTHIVVAPDAYPVPRDSRREFAEHPSGAHLVDASWLADCAKLATRLDPEPYLVTKTDFFVEPPLNNIDDDDDDTRTLPQDRRSDMDLDSSATDHHHPFSSSTTTGEAPPMIRWTYH